MRGVLGAIAIGGFVSFLPVNIAFAIAVTSDASANIGAAALLGFWLIGSLFVVAPAMFSKTKGV